MQRIDFCFFSVKHWCQIHVAWGRLERLKTNISSANRHGRVYKEVETKWAKYRTFITIILKRLTLIILKGMFLNRQKYIWQIFGWQRPINQQILNCCFFSKFFYPQKFVWEIIAITSFAGIWWREKVLEGVAFFSHFLKLIFYEIFSQRQWNLIYSYFSFELKDQEHSTSQNVKFTLRNFSLEEIPKLPKITLLENQTNAVM